MAIDLAVVTVAAQGIRMLPLTKSQPREMLPVGRKPAVQYVVDELHQSGCRRLLFITGSDKSSIENHFSVNENLVGLLRETCREDYLAELDFERQDIDYFFTRQRRQLGLGHAVLCARPLVDQSHFVVALGDSIIGVGGHSDIVQRLTAEFESTQADAVIAIEPILAEHVEQSGIVVPKGRVADRFELADIVEKPIAADAPSNLAVAGRYVFSPRIFDHLARTRPGKDGQIQLSDAIKSLLADGGRVRGVLLREGEHRYDIGDFESYFRTFVEFALADPKYGPALTRHLEHHFRRQGG
jgi:UTP--glucose-1-phosphate uridylyltransferase